MNGDEYIKVVIGNRPPPEKVRKRKPQRKTIRRDNRGKISAFLPNIAVYNHCSICSHIKNFAKEAEELNLGIGLHSEVWEKKESKKHKKKIEEMMEMNAITYVSTPRPNK